MISPKSSKDLSSLKLPQPGEIYYIKDDIIVKHGDKKNELPLRPCLVVMSSKLSIVGYEVVHIVPISKSGAQDETRINIFNNLECIEECFEPHRRSMAIISLYQPIKKEFFDKKLARIDLITYEKICNAIVIQLLGMNPLHFTLE